MDEMNQDGVVLPEETTDEATPAEETAEVVEGGDEAAA